MMKKKLLFIVLYVLGLISVANAADKKPLYWIDPMEPQIHYDKPGKSRMGMDVVPVYAEDEKQDSTITIPASVMQNLGVRTEQVMQGTFARVIRTVGYVSPDENTISHIHPYADGWVKQLFTKISGEYVKKDQLLLRYYSPTIVTAQAEYLIALDSQNKNLIDAAKQKLISLGVSLQQINELHHIRKMSEMIDVYAPQNGIISTLNIREGMRVTPETEIMSISDLSRIWIMIDIYESQAGWVHNGQLAVASLAAFPNQTWKGRIEYVYPQIDPATRTLKVRLSFDNPNEQLKPNMYANIEIFTSPKHDTISIPQEALIRTGNGDRVIIALGDGRFQPRRVIAGFESGDRVEILSGLKAGESVVTSAQFLIDSEASLKGALDRLEPLRTSPSAGNNDQQLQMMIMGQGIIKGIDINKHIISIEHQPIQELNWPAMTMNFTVAHDVDLSQLKIGNKIHFMLMKDKQGGWMISKIHAMGAVKS